jgi:hypothetical protein
MRRRRNPDVANWLLLAGVGVGAYFLYRLFSAGTSAVSSGVNAVSSGIASVISKLTLPPPIVVNNAGRQVAMPDGSSVPLTSFTSLRSNPDGSPTILGNYNGTTLTIDSDGQGNYFAY